MVCYHFFCEFLTSFHEHYNGKCLRPLSWCHKSIERDGYIEFVKREKRAFVDATFLAKYDFTKNIINIKCEYDYFGDDYCEKSEANFSLIDYKKNNYDGINIHGDNVNFYADQEILTLIKQFDQFYLEQTDKLLTKEEFNLYMKHLRAHPELCMPHSSKVCDYAIKFSYSDQAVLIKFDYYDKINKKCSYIEYLMYKNRALGDDFNDTEPNVDFEIVQRFDEIHSDFMTFVEFRLN
jgi:hypothetical protein